MKKCEQEPLTIKQLIKELRRYNGETRVYYCREVYGCLKPLTKEHIALHAFERRLMIDAFKLTK